MLNLILRSLTPLYRTLTALEKNFFRCIPFLAYRPVATTVSIGNLTMGGTGKTPVLIALLREFALQRRSIILSRGYRSPWERSTYLMVGQVPHPHQVTDEAHLVNSYFPEIPIILGKNRAHTARQGEKWFQPELIFLDDGFQYRRLVSDVNILLWDACTRHEEARLIPAGRMREPWLRLQDAHVIFLTRCETATFQQRSGWRDILAEKAPHVPVVEVQTLSHEWISPSGEKIPLSDLPPRTHLFSAIGKPETFTAQVEQTGRDVLAHFKQRDHDHFNTETLTRLAKSACENNAVLVCTEKDRCKIGSTLCEELGIFSLRIGVGPVSGKSFQDELGSVGISF